MQPFLRKNAIIKPLKMKVESRRSERAESAEFAKIPLQNSIFLS